MPHEFRPFPGDLFARRIDAVAALVLAVLLASPAAADEAPRPRVIVTAEQAISWGVIGKNAAFTPTSAEVERADAALPAFLDSSAEFGVGGVRERWPAYGRQYFGVVDSGRRVIVINAFCSHPFGDPTKEYVMVYDGGSCFFHAWYDIESGKVTGIAVNGYA